MGDYNNYGQQYGEEGEDEELRGEKVGSDFMESPENVQAQEPEKKKERKGFFGFFRGKSKKAEKEEEEREEVKDEGAETTGLETGSDAEENKEVGEDDVEEERKDEDQGVEMYGSSASSYGQDNLLKDVDEDDKEEEEEKGEGEGAEDEEEKPKEAAAAKPKWSFWRRGASKKKTESVKAEEEEVKEQELDLDQDQQQVEGEGQDKEEEDKDAEDEREENGFRLLDSTTENRDDVFGGSETEGKGESEVGLDEDAQDGSGLAENEEGGEEEADDLVTRTESKRSTGGGFLSGMRRMFSRKKKVSDEDDAEKEGEEEGEEGGEDKDTTGLDEDLSNKDVTEEDLDEDENQDGEDDKAKELAAPHPSELEEAKEIEEREQANQLKDLKDEDEDVSSETGDNELYGSGESEKEDDEKHEEGYYTSHPIPFGSASGVGEDDGSNDKEEDKEEEEEEEGLEREKAEVEKDQDEEEQEEVEGEKTTENFETGAPMNFELDDLHRSESQEEAELEEDGAKETTHGFASSDGDAFLGSPVLDGEEDIGGEDEEEETRDEEVQRTNTDESEVTSLNPTGEEEEAEKQEDGDALSQDGNEEETEAEVTLKKEEEKGEETGPLSTFLSQQESSSGEPGEDERLEENEEDVDARQQQFEEDQLKDQEAKEKEEEDEHEHEKATEEEREEEAVKEEDKGFTVFEAVGTAGTAAGLATGFERFERVENDTEDKEEGAEEEMSVQGEDEGEDAKKEEEVETITPVPVELDQEVTSGDGEEEQLDEDETQAEEDGEGAQLQLEDGSQDGEARGVAGVEEGAEEKGEELDEEKDDDKDSQETVEQAGETVAQSSGWFPQALSYFSSSKEEQEETTEGEEEEATIETTEEEGEEDAEQEGEDDAKKVETEGGLEDEGTAALTALENVGGEDEQEEVQEGTMTRVKNYLASFCAPSTTTTGTEEQEETEEDGEGQGEDVLDKDEEKYEKALELEKAAALEERELETAQEEETHKQESVTPPGAAKEYEMLVGSRGDGFPKRFSKRALSETVETFDKIGMETGLKVWRLENMREEGGIQVNWINLPEDTHGDFYSGDCYLILNTYTKGQSNKLCYDIHFWLGQDSSTDEQFVVAQQAVELDDKLKGVAVQHREVEYNESKLFQSYFKSIRHMKGGYDSGFNRIPHDDNMNYKRFYLIKQKKKTLHMYEVDPVVSNMNHGDVFVLDLGKSVYVWFGDESSPKERFTGSIVATNIVLGRSGFAKKLTIADEEFWSAIGAKDEKDVPTDSASVKETLENIEEKSFGTAELYRISDASGQLEFTHMQYEGRLGNNLDSTDVFLVHTAVGIYLWEGTHATANEKESSFSIALDFIKSRNLSAKLPITKIKEGQGNALFEEIMKYNRNEAEALKEETRKKLEGFKSRSLNIQVFEDFSKDHRGVEREVAEEFVEELKRENYVGNESQEKPMP